MKLIIDISKDRYDEIMSMDWKNCRRFFDEEIRAIHDGKALEQEPCDDAISRNKVIDTIYCECSCENLDIDFAKVLLLQRAIKALPPVTAQPKMGYWEWVQYDSNPNIGNWHCSECRTIIPHMPEETDNTPIYKWCPMCGCKMQEVEG